MNWSQVCTNGGGAKGAIQLKSGLILNTRTHWTSNEVSVVCSGSSDGGAFWNDISTIAQEPRGADLGDGDLLVLPSGEILFSYRHNLIGRRTNNESHYSIRITMSRDEGKTWQEHSRVAESVRHREQEPDALRGLWSSFLLRKRDGTLQCYYDDEDTPHRAGFHRHQWLTMKTWNAKTRTWINPVIVSRAHHPNDLSRDGMPSVVELSSGRLVCAFESVKTSLPYSNCIRYVTSDDGGKSWSWESRERSVLYAPPGQHMAVSPWMVRGPGDQLSIVFATDEDREQADTPGTHPSRFHMDVKFVSSDDGGETWSHTAKTIFAETHRSYAPGVLILHDGSSLVTFLDYSDYTHRAVHGR